MSRKLNLALAALLSLGTMLAAVQADAKPFPKPWPKPFPVKPWPKPHWHPAKVVYVAPAVAPVVVSKTVVAKQVAPAPAANLCNCLTKEYTKEGVVVFKDVCTKEMATTTVPGSPAANGTPQQSQAPATQEQKVGEVISPDNYAGRSYEDFMATTQNTQSASVQKN